MKKAGLIIGVVALIAALGTTLVSPYCVPCLAIFLGIGAGYLTGVIDRPIERSESTRKGAIAGAIGGIGAALGQIIGMILNGLIVGPERAAAFAESLGFPAQFDPTTYWTMMVGVNFCIGVINVLLMTGLGFLGGMMWVKFSGQDQSHSAGIEI